MRGVAVHVDRAFVFDNNIPRALVGAIVWTGAFDNFLRFIHNKLTGFRTATRRA